MPTKRERERRKLLRSMHKQNAGLFIDITRHLQEFKSKAARYKSNKSLLNVIKSAEERANANR